MKLKQYVVAMEACNSVGKWVWMIELFNTRTAANKKYAQNYRSINMFSRDYRNNQSPQEIELEVSPFTEEKK